jgi:predicted nucleic-acid-binding protein
LICRRQNATAREPDVAIEDAATLMEALHVWAQHPNADFTDCLRSVRVAHFGAVQFVTFDVDASKLPGAALLN